MAILSEEEVEARRLFREQLATMTPADFEAKSLSELYDIAEELELPGYTRLKKARPGRQAAAIAKHSERPADGVGSAGDLGRRLRLLTAQQPPAGAR